MSRGSAHKKIQAQETCNQMFLGCYCYCWNYKNMTAATSPSLRLLCSTTLLLQSLVVAATIISSVTVQQCNREDGISDFTELQPSPEHRRFSWPGRLLVEVIRGAIKRFPTSK